MKPLTGQSNSSKARHFWTLRCPRCFTEVVRVKNCHSALIICSFCFTEFKYYRDARDRIVTEVTKEGSKFARNS
jgi:hypothetical protein